MDSEIKENDIQPINYSLPNIVFHYAQINSHTLSLQLKESTTH